MFGAYLTLLFGKTSLELMSVIMSVSNLLRLCVKLKVRAPDRTDTQSLKITEENVLPL